MTRKEFTEAIDCLVDRYIENFDSFDSNPQISVNPSTLAVTLVNGRDMLDGIAYSDEAIEVAAAAERSAEEDAADFQVKQNPDFYAVKSLLKSVSDSKVEPDASAIDAIAAIYFK